MTRFVIAGGLIALVASAAALRCLSGRSRRRFVAADLATSAIFVALLALTPVIPLELPIATAFAFFALTKLALLFVFLAVDDEALWSASTVGVLTFLVFLLLGPFAAQAPLNGDEPYYLLIAESLVEDGDLDLRNQYADLHTSPVGRTDLRPQPDDPVGPAGERYSRHEPFFAILLTPGFAVAGVHGALVTMAIFAAFLARSFVRLLEEEGVGRRATIIGVAMVVFVPPVINYGARIWPEVPAAWLLVEAIRGLRQRRVPRFALAVAGLVLIKLRFVAVAVVLIAMLVVRSRRPLRAATALLLLLVPFGLLWLIKGNPLGVHGAWELMPREPWRYARGFFGLLLDGAAGIAFQAPFLLIGLFALSRWREVPAAARIAVISAIPYIMLLAVRDEWHGGWSPPLRYLVFLVPFLGLAAAGVIDRASRPGLLPGLLIAASAFLSLHAVAYPWQLFSMADGENYLGEWLSRLQGSDFSRLFPSFIRVNRAAIVASVMLVVAFVTARWWLPRAATSRSKLISAGLVVVLVLFGLQGSQPGRVAHFEDAHVEHGDGSLEPPEYTVARFRFDGGWRLGPGQSVSFLFAGGPSTLRYQAFEETEINVAGEPHILPPTPHGWGSIDVIAPARGRLTVGVVRGGAVFDRIEVTR